MNPFEPSVARATIADINGWEIQSLAPSGKAGNAWAVLLGSTPRIVGDLLPDHDQGQEEGVVFQLEPRDGTAEMDETVRLLRNPDASDPDDVRPGVVMWGQLTCAYESRDRGTFAGVVAFYEDEAEGQALMALAETEVSRQVVWRALDEVDQGIRTLEGNGAHVVPQARRILAQIARLSGILSEGLAVQESAD
jgi:hypothetical protein